MSLHLLEAWLKNSVALFDSAAVVTGSGEVLKMKYETLADLGTLGPCCSLVTKYFQLKQGDVVLVNDPYSGGTLLSTWTLIAPCHIANSNADSLFLVIRLGFRPHLTFKSKLDEEGLRIPPTPIVQNRQLNTAILEAIQSHPLSPKNVVQRIESVLPQVWHAIDLFQSLSKKNPSIATQKSWQMLGKKSEKILQSKLAEIRFGDTKVEWKGAQGEILRARIELSSSGLQVDFSGTNTGTQLCLTDTATFGACLGAFHAYFSSEFPLNLGTMPSLQVTAPLGSWLNAKYPSPTYRGITEGTSLVASQILEALMKISGQPNISQGALVPMQLSLQFDKDSLFYDSLFGGLGAHSSSHGESAIPFWIRNKLQNSVHEVENRFPMRILQATVRKGSGGNGTHRGGDGMVKEYELLAPATLRWLMPTHYSLATKIHFGDQSVIQIFRKDELLQKIENHSGEIELLKGDRIHASSAGGAGF